MGMAPIESHTASCWATGAPRPTGASRGRPEAPRRAAEIVVIQGRYRSVAEANQGLVSAAAGSEPALRPGRSMSGPVEVRTTSNSGHLRARGDRHRCKTLFRGLFCQRRRVGTAWAVTMAK
jgi:hypothetical protein